MIKKNYGVLYLIPFTMAMGIALGIPILLFGLTATIGFAKFMFAPALGTGIPLWAIFVVGIIILMFIRSRRRQQ